MSVLLLSWLHADRTLLSCFVFPHGVAAARAESYCVRPHGSGPEDSAGGRFAEH